MKLQYKLYLFFTGAVLLPMLVATLAASMVLSRSGNQTYENRLKSSLAVAPAVFSGEAHVLSSSLQDSLGKIDSEGLVSNDVNRRLVSLNTLMEKSQATSAVLTGPAGEVIATSGLSVNDSPPMIYAMSTISVSGRDQRQIKLFWPLDTDALGGIFSSQGLDWALLNGDTVTAGSLPAGERFNIDDNGGPESFQSPDAGGQLFRAQINGAKMLTASQQVSRAFTSKDTVLIAGVREEVVDSASREVLKIGLTLMFVVITVAAALGYLMARNITRPLRELNEAATAGISGNLDRLVKVRSKDEVGSLADSFNHMRASIRKNIADIEESRSHLMLALSYTSDILGSTMDRARLIKTTAEAARLATGARGVMVELFASLEPAEHEAISFGVPRHFFGGMRGGTVPKFSAGLAAGTAMAGEIRPLDRDLDMQLYPIAKDNIILGTLVAVYERGQPLEESCQKILNSLTSHAASALENVSIGDLQHRLAITDGLTGLHNLRYLIGAITKEVERSTRYGHSFAVAIMDLDDFKQVNDKYGHPAGDMLLMSVAGALKNSVRASDVVARYGGEEFAVVLPETTKEAAVGVMEKLRRAISDIRLAEYPGIRITVSIGIAGFPGDASSQADLLAHADEALYISKEAGKNRITLV